MTEHRDLRLQLSILGGLTALSSALVACGTAVAPPELVNARSAYDRVSHGQAVQLAPAELDTAKQALIRAESAFQNDGDSSATRHLAYISERKTLQAEAQAGLLQAEREREEMDKEFRKTQLSTLTKTQAELEAERREAEKTKEQLEAERKARVAAEKKLGAAMASLADLAKVKEEARGIVITLSGSVLFATGQSMLLPIAQQKLEEVAKALEDQGYKAILVEGHTDSRGSASKNEELSFRRAESVKSFLISRGLDASKLRSAGLGSSRPVADNSTADGRANNRRVELVVTPL